MGKVDPKTKALTRFAPIEREVAADVGIQQHLGSAWVDRSKSSYSSGLKKYAEFLMATLGLTFNYHSITATSVYSFIVWAGKSTVKPANAPKRLIKSKTIGKYVHGIRTWHLVEHLTKVPGIDNELINLLLRATAKNEENDQPAKIKSAVTIKMMLTLLKEKHNSSEEHNMVITLSLCAFWGMARLGEFIRTSYEEGALTQKDLVFGKNNSGRYIRMHLRKAKTAPPGEIQIIHLQSQPSVLDPVAAIERLLLANKGSNPNSLLFRTSKGPVTKKSVISILESVWGPSSLDQWTGHSFRVGGASLRHNLGASSDIIKNLGRWESVAYLKYIREYSAEILEETKSILQAIDKRQW